MICLPRKPQPSVWMRFLEVGEVGEVGEEAAEDDEVAQEDSF